MKLSQYFFHTLIAEPKDAELISHKLMLKAGLIKMTSSGVYSFLPLGLSVLKNIEKIIRDEMQAIGAIEILMPSLSPSFLWKETGRWEAYGDDMFKLLDRKKEAYGLSPTHEEVVCDIVRTIVKSYKRLPFSLYQIQTKFRDEPRPRGGVIRAREFVMKDAYSFHQTEESANETYQKFFEAYKRIFERCGLNYVIVEASGGIIGGSFSHEFIALSSAGEDTVLVCEKCGYSESLEKAGENKVCKNCSVLFKEVRGIELGHTFKLGTKYSERMDVRFLDENGEKKPIIMGCYGIGVSRIIASVIEQSYDEKGIIFPDSIAPFKAIIVGLENKELQEKVYKSLCEDGILCLYDDRDETPGKKFADADLIGIPYQIIIGKKSSGEKIESCERKTKKREFLSLQEIIQRLKNE